MRLLEIHILEFGGLKDRHFVPGEGLTVFSGENESGKSTLMLFIKFMLYGLAKRRNPERDRAISRDGHRAAGVLTVRAGGEDYRIERTYVDSGRGSDKVSVFRCRDGERVFEGEEPGEALLGVPKEIFESSCSIGQMQCAGLGDQKAAAAIQNLLSTADETMDITQIKKRLEDIRVLYRHKKGDGGRISELNREIHREQTRLEQATETHLRIEELGQRLRENEARLRENESKRSTNETLLREMNRIDLLRRFDELHRNEAELERIREQREAWKQEQWGDAPLPVRAELARLSALADSLERSEQALAEAEEAVARASAEKPYDETQARLGERIEQAGGAVALLERMKRAQGRTTLGNVGLAAGAVIALVGVAIGVAGLLPVGGIVSAAGAILSVGALVLGLQGRKQAKGLAAEYGTTPRAFSQTLTDGAESLRAEREVMGGIASAQARLQMEQTHGDRLKADLQDALRRVAPQSDGTPEAVRRAVSRLETLLNEYARLEQQETTLRGVMEKDRELLSVYQEEELRLDLGVQVGEISQEMMERAKQEQRFLAERERALRDVDSRLRTELINCRARSEDPLAVADRLETLKKELDSCEAYYEAVMTAIDGLEQAGEAMRGNITPAISRTAGKMMDYISDGRYAGLQAGNTLSVSLVENGGLTATSELLSGGTRDAAYLTLRIALMIQIYGEELPPLMMDEALCQVDDRRMKRILSLLGRLSEERLQCLLFTCHDREAEACRELEIPFCEIQIGQK